MLHNTGSTRAKFANRRKLNAAVRATMKLGLLVRVLVALWARQFYLQIEQLSRFHMCGSVT